MKQHRKTIAVLGATGSIGTQTLQVINQNKSEFSVQLLTANKNINELIRRAKNQHVSTVGIHSSKVSICPSDSEIKVLQGRQSIVSFFKQNEIDIVVFGSAGVEDYYIFEEIYSYVKRICIASKEIIVMAGVTGLLETVKENCQVLPVDSEHAAIHQLIHPFSQEEVRKVILTASGGPFYSKSDVSTINFDAITPEQAMKHPTWNMGQKVTIDSATMANKGIELLEAKYLFSLPSEKLSVVIHPQSIIHSMIECYDGSVYMHNSWPDMRIPIAYALFYPTKKPVDIGNEHSIYNTHLSLELIPVANDQIKTIQLAYQAMKSGGCSPLAYMAADEIAVYAFLHNVISFPTIALLIEKAVEWASSIAFNPENPLPEYKRMKDYIGEYLLKD